MKIFSEKRNRYFDRTPPEERFWPRVAKSEGCWIWTGAKKKTGYGAFNPTHKSGWIKAHRFSWQLHFGAIPVGQVVCHLCNMKACVRPDHLYLASSRQNTMDAIRDGLNPIGEKHGRAKLRNADIKEIRTIHASGAMGLGRLSRKYGVSKTQISRIVKRETWKHL